MKVLDTPGVPGIFLAAMCAGALRYNTYKTPYGNWDKKSVGLLGGQMGHTAKYLPNWAHQNY